MTEPTKSPAPPSELTDADDVELRGRRRERARKRAQRLTTTWTTLEAQSAPPSDLRGVEAIAELTRLSEEAWRLSGRPMPTYSREEMPVRWIPGE